MDILTLLLISTKFLLYTGTFFATGMVVYRLMFADVHVTTQRFFSTRKAIAGFACIGLFAAIFSYILAAANLTGELSGVYDTEMLALLWPTPVGIALYLRVLGLGLIVLGCWLRKGCLTVSATSGVIALASFTQIGHIKDHHSLFLQALLMLHLLGIAFWVGILLPLYRIASHREQILLTAEIAHRFGRIASLFVPVLLLAGGWMAYQLLGSVKQLMTTTYGLNLVVKIVLVLLLLVLAACNKWRFVPALRDGDTTALAHLKKSVLMEVILVAVILLVTAILTSSMTLPQGH